MTHQEDVAPNRQKPRDNALANCTEIRGFENLSGMTSAKVKRHNQVLE